MPFIYHREFINKNDATKLNNQQPIMSHCWVRVSSQERIKAIGPSVIIKMLSHYHCCSLMIMSSLKSYSNWKKRCRQIKIVKQLSMRMSMEFGIVGIEFTYGIKY